MQQQQDLQNKFQNLESKYENKSSKLNNEKNILLEYKQKLKGIGYNDREKLKERGSATRNSKTKIINTRIQHSEQSNLKSSGLRFGSQTET